MSEVRVTSAQQLLGAWTLSSWEVGSGDTPSEALEGIRGHLAYTPEGLVFALLAGTASPAHGFEGFLAYCARWELAEGKVVHRVLESSVADWAGTVLVRYASVEGVRLVLRTPPVRAQERGPVHRLSWLRTTP